MRNIYFPVISLFFLLASPAIGQQYKLEGSVADEVTNEALPGAAVAIYSMPDSSLFAAVATNALGLFQIKNIPQGYYRMKVSYLGFKESILPLLMNENRNIGKISLQTDAKLLKTAEVESSQIRTEIKGDTIQMNADAFKTNPDATLEDLVKKMPGMQVENGTVKAGGEQVQKVLIDGKEFFGDDVSMAMKNLPAQVVDKIQYFDKLTDQAQFSGFDDGNSRRTINVVTKGGVKEAKFGKVYAGGGTTDRYSTGANLNIFKNNRRFSIVGQSNNLNQQNFSSEDLLGVSQGSGGVGGRGRMMGMVPGTNDPSNFMVGQQNGINTTHSLGLNYADSLSPKTKISGSYFFNNTYNETQQSINRDFYLNDSTSQFYDENNSSWSNNLNHRLNLRVEINLDSNNSIIYTPRISWQANQSNSFIDGNTSINGLESLSSTSTEMPSNNSGYSMGQNVLFRHKTKKEGRTISLALNVDNNEKSGLANQISSNTFFIADSTFLIRQQTDTYSNSANYSANLIITEPLGNKSQLFLSYRPSLINGLSIRETNGFSDLDNNYTRFDSLLSNRFTNTLKTQMAGAGVRYRANKFFTVLNFNAQYVVLEGLQTFPTQPLIRKTFFNLVPFAMINYKFNRSSNLRVYYRSNTNAPNVNQLQTVLNNSNPIQLSIGNDNLNQEFSQTITTRFSRTNPETSRSVFLNVSATNTSNYIANSTILATADTILSEGIRLRSGSQLSRPVNTNGWWSVRSLLTYSLPVKWLKSTANIQGGLNYQLTPGLINGKRNETSNYGYSGGIVIASNISDKIDFNAGYNAAYNIVENSLQPQLNNNFLIQTANFKGNWLPWKGLVLTSEAAYSKYKGLEAAFNQEFILWNAGIGYKFLKKRAGELKFSAYDILNQNTSISRTVTETFVEDSSVRVLNRYFLLTFTYTFRKFNNMKAPVLEGDDNPHEGPGRPRR
ncbi:MAG: outer membrane beta-barrel protein [Bacteroidia bacterium]